MIEANKMPLPDADRKLKLKTAFSAVGFATTGGTRSTSLSRPGIGIFGAARPSRNPFVCGNPQTKTTTLRMIHGSQARNISDFELRISNFESGLGNDSSTRSLPRRVGVLTSCRQMFFGCQNFKNKESEAIETIAATTSTSHGP